MGLNIFYREILFVNDEIILNSHYAANIMKVNQEKGILEKAFDYPEGFRIIKEIPAGQTFERTLMYGEELCFIPLRGSHIVCYHIGNQKVRGIELAINEKDIPYLYELIEAKRKMGNIVEGDIYKLKTYIECNMKRCEEKKTDIGMLIYNDIKNI